MIKTGLVGLIGLIGLIGSPVAYADSVSGYAWSENIGWIKMRGPGYGVEYDRVADRFSGWAWSEHIGWIKFDGDWARACAGAADSSACDGSAHHLAGGWDGRIKLRGADFGVTYVQDSSRGCYLSGWAWGSEVVGWVKFTGSHYITDVTPCEIAPATTAPIAPGMVSCNLAAMPNRLIRPRRDVAVSWICQNANACSLSGVGAVDAVSGSVNLQIDRTQTFTLSCSNPASSFSSSVEVKVLRPTYCEIIPYGPGCEI